MSQVIYLSPKEEVKATLIFIRENRHNPKGWIEKPNGEGFKLYKPLPAGGDNGQQATSI